MNPFRCFRVSFFLMKMIMIRDLKNDDYNKSEVRVNLDLRHSQRDQTESSKRQGVNNSLQSEIYFYQKLVQHARKRKIKTRQKISPLFIVRQSPKIKSKFMHIKLTLFQLSYLTKFQPRI